MNSNKIVCKNINNVLIISGKLDDLLTVIEIFCELEVEWASIDIPNEPGISFHGYDKKYWKDNIKNAKEEWKNILNLNINIAFQFTNQNDLILAKLMI